MREKIGHRHFVYLFWKLVVSFIYLFNFLFSLSFIYFLSNLCYFLPSNDFRLWLFFFSSFLSEKLSRLFEIFLVLNVSIVMNIPLRTAFTASHKFWCIVFPFLFVSGYFMISSLTYWLYSSMLFDIHIFEFYSFLLVIVFCF